jgi:hypothetical protein
MSIENIINTAGVFLILLAFFLLTIGKLKSNNRIYLLLNITGGILACIGSYLINAIPFIILEGTWAIVALLALIRTFGTKY